MEHASAHRRHSFRSLLCGAIALLMAMIWGSPAMAACDPGANQVSFYGDANFNGPCVTKSVGQYPTAQSTGLSNDTMSSVRVGANVEVVLCRDQGFLGDCIVLSSDSSSLSNTAIDNDQVTSAKVQPRGFADCRPGPSQASFYIHANFLGTCVVRNVGDYNSAALIGLPNDAISSVRVGSNVQLVLCKDVSFKGDCILFTADNSALASTQIGNDTVSSAMVQNRGFTSCPPSQTRVSFYVHSNFLGQCVAKDVGGYRSSNAIGLPNDSISSIRVGNGAEVVICKDNDYLGDCILLKNNVSSLNSAVIGNDAISSARVQPAGTMDCPPSAGQASLYMHSDYIGPCSEKPLGDYPDASAIGLSDNAISSIRINGDLQVCAYDGEGFTSLIQPYMSNTPKLGNKNDQISSIRIQRRGTACVEVAAAPFITAGIELVPGNITFRQMRIYGKGFQAGEIVKLQIRIKAANQNPILFIQDTPADAQGSIDYIYSGSGGGLCNNGGQSINYEVQGSGLTSLKVSNIASTGC